MVETSIKNEFFKPEKIKDVFVNLKAEFYHSSLDNEPETYSMTTKSDDVDGQSKRRMQKNSQKITHGWDEVGGKFRGLLMAQLKYWFPKYRQQDPGHHSHVRHNGLAWSLELDAGDEETRATITASGHQFPERLYTSSEKGFYAPPEEESKSKEVKEVTYSAKKFPSPDEVFASKGYASLNKSIKRQLVQEKLNSVRAEKARAMNTDNLFFEKKVTGPRNTIATIASVVSEIAPVINNEVEWAIFDAANSTRIEAEVARTTPTKLISPEEAALYKSQGYDTPPEHANHRTTPKLLSFVVRLKPLLPTRTGTKQENSAIRTNPGVHGRGKNPR